MNLLKYNIIVKDNTTTVEEIKKNKNTTETKNKLKEDIKKTQNKDIHIEEIKEVETEKINNTLVITYTLIYYELNQQQLSQRHLNTARKVRNNEFYTYLKDIENELYHYNFKNKIVLCPCDSKDSNFYKFFKQNFKLLKLKKLIRSVIHDNIRTTYDGITELDEHTETTDILELSNLISSVDVVVTNPPFSIIQQILLLLNKLNTDFIMIGPLTILGRPPIFELIKNDTIKISDKTIHDFYGENNENMKAPAFWYTTMKKEHDKLPQNKKEKPQHYYHNNNIIFIEKTIDIKNYKKGELLAAPITFLKNKNNYNVEVIELLKTQKQESKKHPHLIKKLNNNIIKSSVIPLLISTNKQPRKGQEYWTDTITGTTYIQPFTRVLIKVL